MSYHLHEPVEKERAFVIQSLPAAQVQPQLACTSSFMLSISLFTETDKMALQTLADHQADQEQTPAENAEATSACHSFSSTTVAKKAEPLVSASSAGEPDVGLNGETKQSHILTGASVTAVLKETAIGENAELTPVNPPAASGCAAIESLSSADVPKVKSLLTGGKGGHELSAGALQVNSSSTMKETLTTPGGERRVSVSSTCDDTPQSYIGRSNASSWTSSNTDTPSFSSDSHKALHSPLSRTESGHVSRYFQSSLKSSGTIKSSGSISTTGRSGTFSGGTSSSGSNNADSCESISKHDNSCTSEESNFERSSPYCSRATSGTTNSSGSIESGATTSGGSSSCCESTRISVDSILLAFETNNSASETSGSSFEEHPVKEDTTCVLKCAQQLDEQVQETEAVLPHEASSFREFSKNAEAGGRCRGPDSCGNGRETNAKASLSSESHGTTQHTPRSSNSSDFSTRRRSSSCSAGGRKDRGRSRLTRARLRLAHPDVWKGEEQQMQKNNQGNDERLPDECLGAFQRRDRGRGKENEALSYGCLDAGAAVTVSPCVFTAGSQSKSERHITCATTNNIFTEEIEYTSKKSCLGLEHSSWSDKQQLCSGSDGDAKTISDAQFSTSSYSRTRLLDTTGALGADARVPLATMGEPMRRSSPRHGSAPGGSSNSRTASSLGARRSAQQQQAGRGSNLPCKSVPEVAVARSPGRSDTENSMACGEDRKSAREEGGRGARGGGQSETGADKDSAVCKREDRWTSPFPGVKYCRSRNAWIARWSESGQEKWKTFPVKDSSFEEARRRALEFRQEKDRQKFERLWQQLNAEGLAAGSNGEMRNTRLSPVGGKLSGADSSSGEGGAAQNHAAAGRATTGQINSPLLKDMRGAAGWGLQQQEEGPAHELPTTPRLTRLSAFRSSLLLNSTQRQQQQRKKPEAQQQHQLEELIGQQGVACEDSGRESISKSTVSRDRSFGREGVDVPDSGRVWLTPCMYTDTVPSAGSGRDEDPLSPGSYRTNGWSQKNAVSNTGMQLPGTVNSTTLSTGSTNSLVSPDSGWLSGEDPVRREPSGSLKVAVRVSCGGEADNIGGKTDSSALTGNSVVSRQQQQHPSVNGLTWTSPIATAEGHEGLAGGRVVEALLRVLDGESADAVRKQGLSPEKIALLLGERGLLHGDSMARLPVEEMPVCRKRRSRDEDIIYTGSDSVMAEAAGSPTAMKILSMYKAALLLIMDDLMLNGLPVLLASGGGTPLGTDYRHLPQALADGKVQLGDRKTVIEHSMRKMLEDQRKCIAEASLLGAVSPFVKLFETCILDQKLPSQADDSGKLQLVYLNALSALQELSLSVKNGNSIVW